MKDYSTQPTLLRRLLLAFVCLATVTAVHGANITVDGINYTTKSDGTATIAKYTIDKTVTPYDARQRSRIHP